MPRGRDPLLPRAEGLYDPANEHDSCGVGVVADMNGRKSHGILQKGMQILINLDHRGATGADATLSDGCGVLTQIPHRFFAEECAKLGMTLPEPGPTRSASSSCRAIPRPAPRSKRSIVETIAEEGHDLIGWRDNPVDNSDLGERVKAVEPAQRQVFIGRRANVADDETFERKLFILRKVISNRIYAIGGDAVAEYYPVSLSCRTIVYKGMVLVHQLPRYYKDLTDPRFETALALVHQRFATNTFPSWRLAHPYRMVAHNGEINTLRGNVNWMAARQASVDSELFGADISKLWPISYEGQSDTACFDNALEFLVRGGYSLAHAMMMLIPEAWAGNPLMDEERRDFYEYHAALMEPWDGPAAMAFTDGLQIGATLDRNGLRPARYLVTDDGLFVLASEMGVLPVPEETIVAKWRLQPGKMLLVDLAAAPHHRRRRDQERARQRQSLSRVAREDADRARRPQPGRAARLAHRRLAARSPAGLRLFAGGSRLPAVADGDHRPGGGRLDGQRHADLGAVGQVEAALHLFQAELRAGHQPADRPDPRRAGDEPRLVHRPAAEPVRSRRPRQRKRLEVRQPILTNEDLEKIRCDRPFRGYVRHQDARHHL